MCKMILLLFSVCLASVVSANEGLPDKPRAFVKGGAYDKPHLFQMGSGKVALGGYAEAHFRFEREEGVTEEQTFVPKRFNLFFHSMVSDRFRMAAELEFEEGTEEILLELAILDFEIHPALTFRAGMLLTPLGKFNLAHDSPANKVTDRPLVSTQIIPTALSEPGMGFFGAFYPSARTRVTYELYAVNGMTDGIIEESDAGTRIFAGRHNIEDNNNRPAFAGRVGLSPISEAEVGLSWHLGQYNTTSLEGIEVDDARNLKIFAIDAEYRCGRYELVGEYALAQVDLPAGLRNSIYAARQGGFYIQGSMGLFQGVFPSLPEGFFEAVTRLDRVDLDADLEGDSQMRLTLGLNFRPTQESVFKLNYLYNWARNRFHVKGAGAGVLFSVATYF